MAEPGVSDAAVRKATGKGWDQWFALLDAWDGTAHSHPEIARHLDESYGIDGWWAQSVTAGYERARGMRAVHERPDGFSGNASKTFPVPVARLFAAFVEPEERQRWLEGVELRNRTNQPHKSARFDVLPDAGRLAVTFIAKGPGKSAAQLQQERLADAEDVAHWKALWKEQLSLLASFLLSRATEEWGADKVGQWSGIVFAPDDIDATHQELSARGVEFTEPPTDQPWGGKRSSKTRTETSS